MSERSIINNINDASNNIIGETKENNLNSNYNNQYNNNIENNENKNDNLNCTFTSWIEFKNGVFKIVNNNIPLAYYKFSDKLIRKISDLKIMHQDKKVKTFKDFCVEISSIWRSLTKEDKEENERLGGFKFAKKNVNIKNISKKRSNKSFKKRKRNRQQIEKSKINNNINNAKKTNINTRRIRRSRSGGSYNIIKKVKKYNLFQSEFFSKEFINNKDLTKENIKDLSNLYDHYLKESFDNIQIQRKLSSIWKNFSDNIRNSYAERSKKLNIMNLQEHNSIMPESIIADKNQIRFENPKSATNSEIDIQDINMISTHLNNGEHFEFIMNNNYKIIIEKEDQKYIKVLFEEPTKKNQEINILLIHNISNIEIKFSKFPNIENYSGNFSFKELKNDSENSLVKIYKNLEEYYTVLVDYLKKGKFSILYNNNYDYCFISFEAKIIDLDKCLESKFKLDLERTKTNYYNCYKSFKAKYFELLKSENIA